MQAMVQFLHPSHLAGSIKIRFIFSRLPSNIQGLAFLLDDGLQSISRRFAVTVHNDPTTGEVCHILGQHLGNKLATIVGFNAEGVDFQVGRDVAMQVASMNPVAVDRDSVPQSVKDSEYNVAVEKTKEEQVKRAVEVALKKAGINPNLVDSEAHIESNIAKGWLTEEEADKARVIAKETAEAKAANLPEQMIKNIAEGRLNKFFKESCLMEQEFIKDADLTIGKYLEKAQKGLVVVAFKRVNLNED